MKTQKRCFTWLAFAETPCTNQHIRMKHVMQYVTRNSAAASKPVSELR